MKKLSLITFLLLVLAACGGDTTDTLTLTAQFNGMGNDTLYLYGVDKYYDRIDTLIVRNDKLKTTLKVDTLTETRLLFSNGVSYPVFIDKQNTIHIQGDATDLQTLEVDGNLPNRELTAFQKDLKGFTEEDAREKAQAFIQSHPFSMASIYLLDRYFVQRTEPDHSLIQKLIDGMSGELKDRPYISELLEKLETDEKYEIGKIIPYFRMPNVKGDRISRTDFKDKHLLLHFWASWDTLSRQQNAIYKRIYKKEAKNKYFGLIGISLDLDKKVWKECIQQDTLKWEQLCDFTAWQTELVKQVGVRTLPYNILISPFGRIEGKNLDEQAIIQKIKEIEQEEKQKEEKRKENAKKKKGKRTHTPTVRRM